MDEKSKIEAIAVDWVCPFNHNPTTPYEVGEVKRLVRFAEDVIIALGYHKVKGEPPVLSKEQLDAIDLVKLYRFLIWYCEGTTGFCCEVLWKQLRVS
ncbi:MAG: hypothetical protein V1709_07075 [Planctomycetota bacterium]